jgi:hypothetical protein
MHTRHAVPASLENQDKVHLRTSKNTLIRYSRTKQRSQANFLNQPDVKFNPRKLFRSRLPWHLLRLLGTTVAKIAATSTLATAVSILLVSVDNSPMHISNSLKTQRNNRVTP